LRDPLIVAVRAPVAVIAQLWLRPKEQYRNVQVADGVDLTQTPAGFVHPKKDFHAVIHEQTFRAFYAKWDGAA
jgi:hypothetical protein